MDLHSVAETTRQTEGEEATLTMVFKRNIHRLLLQFEKKAVARTDPQRVCLHAQLSPWPLQSESGLLTLSRIHRMGRT
ncbi:hypothetical protein AAHA92_14062 [Salvia divinorum]|uniref:Uncharacterized protein n=1 Tax=Salvia divinorum TaxID=28513 RepID=A0ABD1HDN7_SALDI